MNISVFLSYPKPYNQAQKEFIEVISKYLLSRGLEPRTLGVTDYDMEAPLVAIRRLMMESNGLLTIGFRRGYIQNGEGKPKSDIGEQGYDLSNRWITSPYCQIEPAMAFQQGLPILVLREAGVIAEGILEKGVTGTYLSEFNLENPANQYTVSPEWQQLIGKWEGHVRRVVECKGCPPRLY